MPELPEVEVTRRGLEPKAKGRVIARLELRLPKLLKAGSPAELQGLAGRRIEAVGRRAKHLLLELSGGWTLGVHLGMSGQLTFWDHRKADSPGFLRHRHTGLQKSAGQHAPDAHTHLLLHLAGGDRIQYRDPRQFGALRVLPSAGLLARPPFAGLGAEPLEPGLDLNALAAALRSRRAMLKPLLLSQRPVCGAGNIYADEALWLAGLAPRRLASSLSQAKALGLLQALRRVLRQGLRQGGTSFSDFVGADGRAGRNQERLKVYGRAGEPCLRCGRALSLSQVAMRSTVHCRRCQR